MADSPLTNPAAVSEWRRDASPRRVCSCGHGDGEHNTERVKKPCQTGSAAGLCPCTEFALVALEWREHRVVRELV